jgi:hypothetical protein
LNNMTVASAWLPSMEKPFPYMEKLLQAPNHDVSAGSFPSVISRWQGRRKANEMPFESHRCLF